MSGGGVQIFSMGIVFMLLITPFKNIAGINDGPYSAYSQGIFLTIQYSLLELRTLHS